MSHRRALVEIDLSSVQSSEELQATLAKALDFPEWYGHNWNAFWDAITGLVEMPHRLLLLGWGSFETQLPGDSRQLRESLDEMAAKYPEDAAIIEYN